MIKISQKTLDDLEFDAVVLQIAAFSITALGRSEIEQLVPYGSKEKCIQNLNLVHEFVSSFDNENRIPNHGFEDISEELKLLRIENIFWKWSSFGKYLCSPLPQTPF